MDIKEKGSKLNKKIEKVVSILTDGTALSQAQCKEKGDTVKGLQKELVGLQQQLQDLKVTKINVKLHLPLSSRFPRGSLL